ncbi:MAG TPA: hypothetical protein PLR73_01765 [Acetivibrio sp.]|nr:hypothetical protein [Clostridium sp.]HOQ36416.1 hypothetical protein [Acetivibrio sp.]
MVIDAVVDRVEKGYAVLICNDCGLEISIPVNEGEKEYVKGEKISLVIGKDGVLRNVG